MFVRAGLAKAVFVLICGASELTDAAGGSVPALPSRVKLHPAATSNTPKNPMIHLFTHEKLTRTTAKPQLRPRAVHFRAQV